MEIGETLRRALAKLVMRAAWDQAMKVCGNLQLSTGLEVGIEGATHAVGQCRLKRVWEQRRKEEEAKVSEEEEGEGVGVVECLNNVTIEKAGTEEEAAEGLKAALGMAPEGIEVEAGGEGEGEGVGVGVQRE